MALDVFEWSGKTEVFRENDSRMNTNFLLKGNGNGNGDIQTIPIGMPPSAPGSGN